MMSVTNKGEVIDVGESSKSLKSIAKASQWLMLRFSLSWFRAWKPKLISKHLITSLLIEVQKVFVRWAKSCLPNESSFLHLEEKASWSTIVTKSSQFIAEIAHLVKVLQTFCLELSGNCSLSLFFGSPSECTFVTIPSLFVILSKTYQK